MLDSCEDATDDTLPESRVIRRLAGDSHLAPLTHAEERHLAQQSAGGNAEARNRLIQANIGLVYHLAKRHIDRGVEYQDLVSAGMYGLLRAVDKFDWRRGYRLTTYAHRHILAHIGQSVDAWFNNCHSLSERGLAVKHFIHTTNDRIGRDPTAEEVAQELHLPLGRASDALARATPALELDAIAGDWDEWISGHFPDPEQVADDRSLSDSLAEALDSIPPREAHIVRMYFGLGTDTPVSVRQVADIIGVSHSRIAQLLHVALPKLREHLQRTWTDAGVV